MPRLRSGQPVLGKLTKKPPQGNGKRKNYSQKDGDGSESQKQKWEFHELLPSDIHNKPTQ